MKRRPPPLLPAPTLRDWERADMAGLMTPIRGLRAILVNASGSHYEWRVWSELETADGHGIVWVVTEVEWWRHQNLAMSPAPVRWPAAAVWVET